MEAQTATTPSAAATGSKTLADLLPLAVEKHADLRPAVQGPGQGRVGRRLLSGARRDRRRSSRSASRTLGIERGDKVGILSNTRPEWTYSDFAILCAGGDRGPIYQTNSPEECHYVLDHSESEGGDPRGRGAAREDPQGPRPAAAASST